MITLQDIQNAQTRIAPYVKRTPLVKSRTLSEDLGTNVYIKLELFQNTGSFKPRGAFNRMLQLTPQQREMGVVAVSGAAGKNVNMRPKARATGVGGASCPSAATGARRTATRTILIRETYFVLRFTGLRFSKKGAEVFACVRYRFC